MIHFRANGKLLLTGEYLVLHGAVALAVPTKLGQTLTVATQGKAVQWDAYQPKGPWLSATLHPSTLDILETDDLGKASKLAEILKVVRVLNPSAFESGLHFETHLEFNPAWGLGSSSTLISNLAQWAGVNPYEVLKRTIGGSGYDLACATANTAIHYKLDQGEPRVQPVVFNPPFVDRLYFVYQEKKQHSSEEVRNFNQHWEQTDLTAEMQVVSELSMALPTITYYEDFCTLLQVHESILARCLDREPVQQQYPDFDGVLKSLGAWGGDFLLAVTEKPFEDVSAYFQSKGMNTIFKYQDLIL
jgi:mevalonate kinase